MFEKHRTMPDVEGCQLRQLVGKQIGQCPSIESPNSLQIERLESGARFTDDACHLVRQMTAINHFQFPVRSVNTQNFRLSSNETVVKVPEEGEMVEECSCSVGDTGTIAER